MQRLDLGLRGTDQRPRGRGDLFPLGKGALVERAYRREQRRLVHHQVVVQRGVEGVASRDLGLQSRDLRGQCVDGAGAATHVRARLRPIEPHAAIRRA